MLQAGPMFFVALQMVNSGAAFFAACWLKAVSGRNLACSDKYTPRCLSFLLERSDLRAPLFVTRTNVCTFKWQAQVAPANGAFFVHRKGAK